MFEAFTERARRIIFFARYEASVLGSTAIAAEHLLLGVLREGGSAAESLRAQGFDPLALRQAIEKQVAASPAVSTSVDIPLSPSAKEALDIAVEEGQAHPVLAVGPEEILIGIFREGRSLAARLLAEGPFDVDAVRTTGRAEHPPRRCRRCGRTLAPAAVEPRLHVRLDGDPPYPPHIALAAAVCTACGLVEWSVESPGRLRTG